MHKFIEKVAKPSNIPQLRYLEAKVYDPDFEMWYYGVWAITTEREVFEAHPHLIKALLDQYPLIEPRKIVWSTHDPLDYSQE